MYVFSGRQANSYHKWSNVRRMAGKASMGAITHVTGFEKKSKKLTAIAKGPSSPLIER